MASAQSVTADDAIDADNGIVDRRIFSDEEIYKQELKQIFARAWNFMCHESQIREPGDFFMNYIGEDQVIVVRDRQGEVQVLLNSCPHRGNTVCRAEQGKARRFTCSYHGWSFMLDGRLVGMPGEDKYYHNDVDKEKWGLAKAAKVDIYKGFVFATMDEDAPPLEEFLGWVGRVGLDMIAARGDVEVVDGILKNRIKCNWKLAVDNVFDWYHPIVSHSSAFRINVLDENVLYPEQQMVMLGDFGHAIGGPCLSSEDMAAVDQHYGGDNPAPVETWEDYQVAYRARAEVKEAMGPVGVRTMGHPHIFPNFWICTAGSQICLRIPRGPFETELWWFTVVEKEMPAKARKDLMQLVAHLFGPAGLLEQDDGENWAHSTKGAMGHTTKERPLNYKMGLGHGEIIQDPSGQSRFEGPLNEYGQVWTYKSWQAWMQAKDWEELKRIHPEAPTQGVV